MGEGKGKRERNKNVGEKHQRMREKSVGCLSHAPNQGPGLQPTGDWTGDPSVYNLALNPLSHTSQGGEWIFRRLHFYT